MVESTSSSKFDSRALDWKRFVRRVLEALHLLGLAIFLHRQLRYVRYGLVTLLRAMSKWPRVGPAFDTLAVRLDGRQMTHFGQTEFLRVIEAVKSAGLTFWVAGGWGLDVLVGCETRRHGDIDIVLNSYVDDLGAFDALARSLGYRHLMTRGGTAWFPDAAVYENERGLQFEALGIDWGLLRSMHSFVSEATAASSDPSDITRSLLEYCTTEGRIGATSVPALSLEAQRLFHSGYEKRREDDSLDEVIDLITNERDGWRLPDLTTNGAASDRRRSAPITLLFIPVFDLPDELWRLCKLYHNDLDHIAPHITVAYPFLPLTNITADVVETLGSFFAAVPTVDFAMDTLTWFGSDVVYLEPTPVDAFRSMVVELQRVFPDFVPYDGEFETIVPHLTLSEHGSEGDRRQLAQRAKKFLPLSATATHVWLMSNHRHEGDWTLIKVFELGEGA